MGDRFCIRKRQTSSWSQDRLQDAWYRGYSESHDRAVCGSLHERFGVVKSFETMDEYHLIKQFSKPQEGEFVPITFIEFKRKMIGAKNIALFERRDPGKKVMDIPEKNLLSDML